MGQLSFQVVPILHVASSQFLEDGPTSHKVNMVLLTLCCAFYQVGCLMHTLVFFGVQSKSGMCLPSAIANIP